MPLAVPTPRLIRQALAGVAGALLAVAVASAQRPPAAGAAPPGSVAIAAPPAAAVPTSPLSPHPQVWSTTAREPAVVQGGTWGPAYVVEPPAYDGFSVYVPAWGWRPPHPGTPGGGHPARPPAHLPRPSPHSPGPAR
jgi:hypothetical protein